MTLIIKGVSLLFPFQNIHLPQNELLDMTGNTTLQQSYNNYVLDVSI